VAAALAVNPTYPALFQAAFGDAAINSLRIAFALATYQRTLRPDQTPHDRNQLTPNQQAGRQVFLNQGGCVPCHGGGTFTDFLFHNNGIRPWQEDSGRMGVTGNFADRGRFKTAQLRNVGLKTRFFHNGQFGTLEEVVAFYNRGGDFADNRDPRITPRGLAPLQQSQLVDFLRNGLTDPRVAAETPPFDRPTLWVERNPPGAELYGNDLPGSGGLRPLILARSPAQIPNPDFRIGVGQGLGGADALLVLAAAAAPPGTVIEGIPVNVSMAPGSYAILPMTLGGSGAGAGTATFLLPLPNEPALQNLDLFAQWFVMDPAAPGGIASATRGALIRTF
jgi:hypothetical protein